jgi:hypothetical protein
MSSYTAAEKFDTLQGEVLDELMDLVKNKKPSDTDIQRLRALTSLVASWVKAEQTKSGQKALDFAIAKAISGGDEDVLEHYIKRMPTAKVLMSNGRD